MSGMMSGMGPGMMLFAWLLGIGLLILIVALLVWVVRSARGPR